MVNNLRIYGSEPWIHGGVWRGSYLRGFTDKTSGTVSLSRIAGTMISVCECSISPWTRGTRHAARHSRATINATTILPRAREGCCHQDRQYVFPHRRERHGDMCKHRAEMPAIASAPYMCPTQSNCWPVCRGLRQNIRLTITGCSTSGRTRAMLMRVLCSSMAARMSHAQGSSSWIRVPIRINIKNRTCTICLNQ